MEPESEITEKIDFNRRYTLAEFLELEFPDDGIHYELINGRIFPAPPIASALHGRVLSTLNYHLAAFARFGKLRQGTVFVKAPCNFGRFDEANYLAPDVCFVAEGRIPDEFEGAIPVAPDLVAEVNSPSDTTERIHNKIKAYLEAGVKAIWSVYMLDKFVLVYEAGNPDIKLYNLRDELDGGAVLSGFKLPMSAIFS